MKVVIVYLTVLLLISLTLSSASAAETVTVTTNESTVTTNGATVTTNGATVTTNTATLAPTNSAPVTSTETIIIKKPSDPTNIEFDHPFGVVYPILDCVILNPSKSTYTAYFGFQNGEQTNKSISVGKYNTFLDGQSNRSQTTLFSPGRSYPYPNSAFNVVSPMSSPISWVLNGYAVSASVDSPKCNLESASIDVEYDVASHDSNQTELVNKTAQQLGVDPSYLSYTYKDMPDETALVVITVNNKSSSADNTVPINPNRLVQTLFSNNAEYSEYVSTISSLGYINQKVSPHSSGVETYGKSLNNSTDGNVVIIDETTPPTSVNIIEIKDSGSSDDPSVSTVTQTIDEALSPVSVTVSSASNLLRLSTSNGLFGLAIALAALYLF